MSSNTSPDFRNARKMIEAGDHVGFLRFLNMHPEILLESDDFFGSLLHCAINSSLPNLAIYICQSMNSDLINLRRKSDLRTALHLACLQGSPAEVLEKMLSRKASPNFLDENGDTPLHLSIKMKNESACRILIAHNADPTISNKAGLLPITLAKLSNADFISIIDKHTLNFDGTNLALYGCDILGNSLSQIKKQILNDEIKLSNIDDSGRNLLHHIAIAISKIEDVFPTAVTKHIQIGNAIMQIRPDLLTQPDAEGVTPMEILSNGKSVSTNVLSSWFIISNSFALYGKRGRFRG